MYNGSDSNHQRRVWQQLWPVALCVIGLQVTVSIKSNNVSRTQRHYRMRCNTGSNIDHTCFAWGFWSAGMPLVISWKYLYEVSDPSMRTLPSFLYPVGFSLCEKAKQPAGVRTSPMLEPCVVCYCY